MSDGYTPHFFNAVFTDATVNKLKSYCRNKYEVINSFHIKKAMLEGALIVEIQDQQAERLGEDGLLVAISETGFSTLNETKLEIWSISIVINKEMNFGYRFKFSKEKNRMYAN